MPQTISWPFRRDLHPAEPEFQAQVRALVGQPYQNKVDPARARFLSLRPDDKRWLQLTGQTPTLKGFYITPNAQLKEDPKEIQALRSFLLDPKVPLERDTAYGTETVADSKVWAHEFRHRAGVDSEQDNRLLDAFYANSRQAWKKAVLGWADYMSSESGQPITYENAEKNLTQRLLSNSAFSRAGQERAKSLEPETTVVEKAVGMLSPKQANKNKLKQKIREPWRLWAKLPEEDK